MLINLGRLLMLCVWAFLLLNLFQPFPKPLNIFVNVALIFMDPDARSTADAAARRRSRKRRAAEPP